MITEPETSSATKPMPAPVVESCGTCRFWKSRPDIEDFPNTGNCRFDPPVITDADKNASRWPTTPAAGWCGKFKKV